MLHISSDIEAQLDIAEKEDTRIYHPQHNKMFGGDMQGILLGQMRHRWHYKGQKAFYKFVTPPEKGHAMYISGDSWVEELGIPRRTFNNYCIKLGLKITIQESENWKELVAAKQTEEGRPIYFVYWTNRSDNRTWWHFNDDSYLYARLLAYGLADNVPCPWGADNDIKLRANLPLASENDELKADLPLVGAESDSPDNKESFKDKKQQQDHNPKSDNETLSSFEKILQDSVDDDLLLITPLDGDGMKTSLPWDNKHPFVKAILDRLLPKTTNLEGTVRRGFYRRVLDPAIQTPRWGEWCLWQAFHNAKGENLSTFYNYIEATKGPVTFQNWLEGAVEPADDIANKRKKFNGIKKGSAAHKPKKSRKKVVVPPGPKTPMEDVQLLI